MGQRTYENIVYHDLGDKVTANHPKVFPVLKRNCAKYNVSSTVTRVSWWCIHLGSRSMKGHQNISLALKHDCAKYQVCTTNTFLSGAKTKFCGGSSSGRNGLQT